MISLNEINVNLLVALDALLREKNVRLAAIRTGVTQSAMSHSLRQLRSLLGDPVLVRHGNRMLPTPRAELMAAPLEGTLRELYLLINESPEFRAETTERTFTFAMNERAALLVVPCLMREMQRLAPSARVDVRNLRGTTAVDALAAGAVDAYIGVPLDRDAVFERAWTEVEHVVIARREHPALAGGLDLDAYCQLSHVMVGVEGTGQSLIDRLLEKRGRSRRIGLRTESFMAGPWIVAESDLLMTVPTMGAVHFQRHLPLQLLAVPLPMPTRPAVVAWHERFDDDPASTWIRGVVATALARVVHESSASHRIG